MTRYKVTGAYVTARVRSAARLVAGHQFDGLTGFYKDAVLPDGVEPEDVEHLLRDGQIESVPE